MILPERNSLRNRQNFALFEGYAKVNVYHFSSTFIN